MSFVVLLSFNSLLPFKGEGCIVGKQTGTHQNCMAFACYRLQRLCIYNAGLIQPCRPPDGHVRPGSYSSSCHPRVEMSRIIKLMDLSRHIKSFNENCNESSRVLVISIVWFDWERPLFITHHLCRRPSRHPSRVSTLESAEDLHHCLWFYSSWFHE